MFTMCHHHPVKNSAFRLRICFANPCIAVLLMHVIVTVIDRNSYLYDVAQRFCKVIVPFM